MSATVNTPCPVDGCGETLTATVDLKISAPTVQGEKPGLYLDIETENVTFTPESKAHVDHHLDSIDYRGES